MTKRPLRRTESKNNGEAKQDPFRDREASRYEHPIPSREFILDVLSEAGIPMVEDDLARLPDLSFDGLWTNGGATALWLPDASFDKHGVGGGDGCPGALDDAADVDVDRQNRAAQGETGDGDGGVAADAREPGEVFGPAITDDGFSGPVEIDGSPVVAQALPGADNLRAAGGCEADCRGPALHPLRPALDDAGYLRLLQHDLGDEHRPGVARTPPGQISPGRRVPLEQQALRRHGR